MGSTSIHAVSVGPQKGSCMGCLEWFISIYGFNQGSSMNSKRVHIYGFYQVLL